MVSRLPYIVALAVLIVCCDSALAQQFPTKAIEIVVPFVPGGGSDLGARVIAKALQEKWKVPIKVVNQPGGNTVPGVDGVMRAPPDGYRLLWDTNTSSSVLAVAVSDLPYSVLDRTFICLITESPVMLAVQEDSPFKSIADVVSALKSKPESITWTSFGGSSSADIAFRRLAKSIDLDVNRTRAVSVRGGAEAATQVAGGHVMLGIGGYASFASFIASNKLRILTIFSSQRHAQLPSVPTTSELGYAADAILFNGLSGPIGIPQVVVEKWQTGVREVIADQQVVVGLDRVGLDVKLGDSEAMRRFVVDEIKILEDLYGKRASR